MAHQASLLLWMLITAIDWQNWPEPIRVDEWVYCLNSAPFDEEITAEVLAPKEAEANSLVVLDGSGSSVPQHAEALSFRWRQLSNGAPSVTLSDAESAMASFRATEAATYSFELELSWLCRTATSQVSVAILPSTSPPTQLIVSNIVTFTGATPVGITHPPNDPRLFITLKTGQIRIFEQGSLLSTPFLDLSDRVNVNGFEQGLLGLAFSPDYASSGWFYLDYTGSFPNASGNNSSSRLVGYQRDQSNPNLANPDSAALLLSVTQPESNHNGGHLLFGPDGKLYYGLGDGGGGGDQHGTTGNGQDKNTLLGKLLRLQVAGGSYSIPSDNPFVGQANTREEIWAYGLRNPWIFSFDRLTEDLYIADVGQNEWEEINFQPAGEGAGWNYGWRFREGAHCYNPSTGCPTEGLVDPIYEYNHNGLTASITGGYVYRGSAIPALEGYYLFADYGFRKIWALTRNGNGWQAFELDIRLNGQSILPRVLTFGEDLNGELYFSDDTGKIYQIIDAL